MLSKLKSLASDTLIYGTFQVLGKFFAFFLTPIYTNAIPNKAELGDVYYIYSLLAFINIFFSFGMESSFFRFYKHDDLAQCRKVFTHAFVSIAAVSFVMSVLLFATAGMTAPLISDSPKAAEWIKIAAVIPFFDALILIPYALLRMTRRAKRFAYSRFFLIVFNVILNFIFVVWMKDGARGVLIANFVSSLAGVVIFSPEIFAYLVPGFDYGLIRDMIRFGLPTLPASLSSMILQLADRPILRYMADSSVVAIYQTNYRLGIPMLVFTAVFEYAWKPFYLSHHKEADSGRLFARVLTYFTMISALIFLVGSFYISFIVRMPFLNGKFINPQYWPALGIVPIILASYFFNGVFTNFTAGFLITKKTKYLPIAVGFAALINVLMNILLIPSLSYWGSAWANLGAYLASAVLIYIISRKIYPIKYEWNRIAIIIVSVLAVFIPAQYLTADLPLPLAFIIRTLALFFYAFMLKMLGFFTPEEIRGIKKLFHRQ